jgi:hypothetical protein
MRGRACSQRGKKRWTSTLAKISNFKFKKRFDRESNAYYLWEGRGRRNNVFYIESVKVDP